MPVSDGVKLLYKGTKVVRRCEKSYNPVTNNNEYGHTDHEIFFVFS